MIATSYTERAWWIYKASHVPLTYDLDAGFTSTLNAPIRLERGVLRDVSSFDFAFGISYNAVFMKRTIQFYFLVTIFGCSALLAQSPDRRQTSTTPSDPGHATAPE
jgi:hypothetical protein